MNAYTTRQHRADPRLSRLPSLIAKFEAYGSRHYLNPKTGRGVTILGWRTRGGSWCAIEDGSTGFDSKVHIYADRPSMFRNVERMLSEG